MVQVKELIVKKKKWQSYYLSHALLPEIVYVGKKTITLNEQFYLRFKIVWNIDEAITVATFEISDEGVEQFAMNALEAVKEVTTSSGTKDAVQLWQSKHIIHSEMRPSC